MNNRKHLPLSLKIVAILGVLAGLTSLLETLGSFMTNHVKINFGIIELFTGIGLLRGIKIWRSIALLVIWITFIATPTLIILHFSNQRELRVKFFGQIIKPLPIEVVITFGVIILVYCLIKHIVLFKKDVLAYFNIKN